MLQDKEDSDKNARLEEQAAKTRQAQANLTTPKTTLMKLTGYTDWIPWLHQLGEFTKDITREQSKVALVVTSLKDKGSTSYKEIMLYLKKKYHRADEVASAILGRVQEMKIPGDSKIIQKTDMLAMENIRRDLAKVRMQSRLDVYFIK